MKILRSNDEYEFLLGEDAMELFEYYGVDVLHGLDRTSCLERQKEGGRYIDGMCNLIPNDYSRFYIFINLQALDGSYRDITLVQHETTHGGFIKYNHNPINEEEIISWGEELTNEIMPLIFREINLKRYDNRFHTFPKTGLNI
jgi:hypothetical protein